MQHLRCCLLFVSNAHLKTFILLKKLEFKTLSMDYNFNLKHETQKKFKMSQFLQPSGFERCFSTSSKINMAPCGAGNLAVNPLKLVNIFSGLHSHNPNNLHHNLPEHSKMQSGPFSSSAGVSVSCFVSGFVSPESQTQSSSKYCNGILLDVLLNEITLEKAAPSPNFMNKSCPGSMKTDVSFKRTYAEVTKEKPKPARIRNTTTTLKSNRSIDNFTKLQCNSNGHMFPLKEDKLKKKAMDVTKPCRELFYKPRQHSCSSSSDSSLESDKRKSRTSSECSVDSDDSYIVFENDDEATVFDIAEEDASSDGSDEVEDRIPKTLGATPVVEPVLSKKCTKKVTFKADEDLVTVHLVESDDDTRAGPWEEYARDRVRFHNRIQGLSTVISPVLSTTHRENVYRKRFMTHS